MGETPAAWATSCIVTIVIYPRMSSVPPRRRGLDSGTEWHHAIKRYKSYRHLRGSMSHETTRVVVNLDLPGARISRHLYGHFAEHLGRCIYGGFYVGE